MKLRPASLTCLLPSYRDLHVPLKVWLRYGLGAGICLYQTWVIDSPLVHVFWPPLRDRFNRESRVDGQNLAPHRWWLAGKSGLLQERCGRFAGPARVFAGSLGLRDSTVEAYRDRIVALVGYREIKITVAIHVDVVTAEVCGGTVDGQIASQSGERKCRSHGHDILKAISDSDVQNNDIL